MATEECHLQGDKMSLLGVAKNKEEILPPRSFSLDLETPKENGCRISRKALVRKSTNEAKVVDKVAAAAVTLPQQTSLTQPPVLQPQILWPQSAQPYSISMLNNMQAAVPVQLFCIIPSSNALGEGHNTSSFLGSGQTGPTLRAVRCSSRAGFNPDLDDDEPPTKISLLPVTCPFSSAAQCRTPECSPDVSEEPDLLSKLVEEDNAMGVNSSSPVPCSLLDLDIDDLSKCGDASDIDMSMGTEEGVCCDNTFGSLADCADQAFHFPNQFYPFTGSMTAPLSDVVTSKEIDDADPFSWPMGDW